MTDNESRGLVLRAFYEHRKDSNPFVPSPEHFEGQLTVEEILRICEQLKGLGYVEGGITRSFGGGGIALVRITARGSDVMEGMAKPIGITVMSNSYNISNSTNVAIGDGNQQTVNDCVAELARLIEAAKGTPQQKEEAKGLLRKFLEHPLLSAVAGGALAGLVG